jgi:predicted nucleic acid-binding protein
MRLILADTGIVSRRLTEKQPIVEAFEYIGKERIVVSSITKIELFNWVNGYKNQLGKKAHRNLVAEINKFPVIQIDRKVSSVAVELSKYHFTKVADLLIASTALHHGIEIFTVNSKDFKNLKGVDLYTPPNYSEIKKTL